MNVPKWLIPVISVIAALAVGVALCLVGTRFASTVTVDRAAGTKVVPVLQPALSGVTPAQADQLLAAHKIAKSPISGQSTVAIPTSAIRGSSLKSAVELIAHGGGSTDIHTPAPTPSSSPATPTPPTPAPTADSVYDICAPADGPRPPGCPDGITSRVLAETAAPALSFTIQPYTAPCGTTPSRNARNTATHVPVLLTSTVPTTYKVYYTAWNPNPYVPGEPPLRYLNLELPLITTDSGEAAAWNAARASNVATTDLPPLTTCIDVPSRWTSGSIGIDIMATTDDGQSEELIAYTDSSGLPTPQPVHVDTFGTSDFVAYADYPTDESLQIQAYGVPAGVTPSCSSLGSLQGLRSTYSTASSWYPGESNEPATYTMREAIGFQVTPGTSTLVCASWFHGRASASFDRVTPLRRSSTIVESPDLDVPELAVDQFEGTNTDDGYIEDSRVSTILMSAASPEGLPCGSATTWEHGAATFGRAFHTNDIQFCSVSAGRGAYYDPGRNGFVDTAASNDLIVTSAVTSTSGSTTTSDFRLDLSHSVCIDCTDSGESVYEVPLPGINGSPSVGTSVVILTHHHLGHSGVNNWTTIPQLEPTPAPVIGGPPLLNTDFRIVTDTDRTTTASVTARLDVQVNEDADYTVAVRSLDGSAPCTLNGGTGIATGHFTGTTNVHVYIPNLCFGSLYLARVTLTNATGTTTWGGPGASNQWAGALLLTPYLHATMQYTYTVTPPAGKVLTDFDLHLDQQDFNPGHALVGGCSKVAVFDAGAEPIVVSSHPVLHVHYRIRTAAPGTTCAAAATDATAEVDRDVPIDLAAVVASPSGYRVAVGGPVVLTITIRPSS